MSEQSEKFDSLAGSFCPLWAEGLGIADDEVQAHIAEEPEDGSADDGGEEERR